MTTTSQDGVRNLLHTLLVGSTTNTPFDSENEELQNFLRESAYLSSEDLQDLGDNLHGGTSRRNKSKLRYLAALLPDKSLHELASSVHYIIDNSHLGISDVRDILRGQKQDVSLEKIQAIGKNLMAGESLRQTALNVGVAFETVDRIDSFVGITEARRLKLVDFACDAVRSGWSIRKFADKAGIPKSTAYVYLKKAKSVLIEIGELPNE